MDKRPFEYVASGQEAWHAGDSSRAEADFRRGLEAYRKAEPDGADFALGRLAAFLIDQGRAVEAMPLLQEAIDRGTDIPAIWFDYLALLASRRDVDALMAAAAMMRRGTHAGVEPTEYLLTLSKRADRAGDLGFGISLVRAIVADSELRGDRLASWSSIGVLGHLLERAGQAEEAKDLWQRAFAVGSTDPFTANRLSMMLEKQKDFVGAKKVIAEALARGLPANTEEQLRRRLVRCEAKLDPAKPKRKDVAAFTIRLGEGHVEPLFQVRISPPIRDLEITDNIARCLGRSKEESVLTLVDLGSGDAVSRVEHLPRIDDAWFSPEGLGVGIRRTGRIGGGITELYFLDADGTVGARTTLPDATSQIAWGRGLWYVGCRDGSLYAFSPGGALAWSWVAPGANVHDGPATLCPCPYFVTVMGQDAVISSMGDIYAIDPGGATLWHTRLPNEERTTYTTTVPIGGRVPDATEAYSALELRPGASFDEVRSSYRRLALATHPDRNPDDPEASSRFIVVQSAYEAIVSGKAQSAGSAGSITMTIQMIGMDPLVSSLHASSGGVVACSSQGRLYRLDPMGTVREVRALGHGFTTAIIDEEGRPTAAWCDGALYFLRDGQVVNAAEVSEPPMGLARLGEEILHWKRNRAALTDLSGRSVWAVEFSKSISGLAAAGRQIVVGAGVLCAFGRT